MNRRMFVMVLLAGQCLAGAAPVLARPYSYFSAIEERNVFRPIWNIKTDNRSELEKARLEEERKQAELVKQQELQALENKKKELQQGLSLSGVVFDGKNYYAMITDRISSQSGNYTIGNVLEGASIVAIDEKTQSVDLDFEGKFKITIRISGQ